MKHLSQIFLVVFVLHFAFNASYSQLVNDFRVNDNFSNQNHFDAKQGFDSLGNYIVVWEDHRISPTSIYCQRFNSQANFLGNNFKINVNSNPALSPDVSVKRNGSFAVCWFELNNEPNYGAKIKLRLYNNNAIPVTNEILVNDSSGNFQTKPSIGTNSKGDIYVVWEYSRGLIYTDIFYQKFDSTGNKIGNNIKVNDDLDSLNRQRNPAISVRSDGSFLITWDDSRTPATVNGEDIYFQMYDKLGSKIGVNRKVNDDTISLNLQHNPKIASDSLGKFVVSWNDDRNDNSHNEVYLQRYDSLGIKLGGNFRVTTSPTFYTKALSSIFKKPNGEFIIFWTEVRNFIGSPYFQRFREDGGIIGNNFQVTSQFSTSTKFSNDIKIFGDRVISIWSDERNGHLDVYCNIRSFLNPDTTVDVISTSSISPKNFTLSQNFPNPFNLSTIINFEIIKNDFYILEVYNIMGQKVETIFRKNISVGFYDINYFPQNLSSGIYLYTLSSSKEKLNKSFLLIK